MGIWEERALPRLVELTCGGKDMAKFRARTVEGLSGTIVEVGFGSGLNAPVYPPEVTTVKAIEPSALARERSARHTAGITATIDFVGLDGARLPLADASCDGALSTFTLCTIPDVATALDELYRVVRPGGRFHFLEHGRAPDESVRTWQRRFEPVQKRVAGGCHLTRDAETLVSDAGFEIVELERRYVKGPKPFAFFTLGRAVRPA
jgi:ubiquinone/menaquinone biosynthesis C-methylase UbiE